MDEEQQDLSSKPLEPISSCPNLPLDKNDLGRYKNSDKKTQKNRSMRFISTFLFLAAAGAGLWWVDEKQPDLKIKALQIATKTSVNVLESRFSASQLLEKEKGINQSEFFLKYHPYLLMEVKFINQASVSEEGVILWDLIDGEMVLDSKIWKKTHGFADCINSAATYEEYRIVTSLALSGGVADRTTLINNLEINPSEASLLLEKCRKKKLIVKQGNHYRLHLQNPLFHLKPVTDTPFPLVTKNVKTTEKMQRRYSPSQIKKAAEAAFGEEFAIRHTQEVFLPIYSVKSSEGGEYPHTIHLNAISGQKISNLSFIE